MTSATARYMRRVLFLLCCLLVLPKVSLTQSQDLPLPSVAKTVMDSFEKPLHPLLGGVAPGGGLGLGIGYATPKSEDWFHNGSAMVTVNRFWMIEGETGRQTQRTRVGVFGNIRDMSRLDFFGLGPDSLRSDRTNFRLRETTAGAKGWVRLNQSWRTGGYAEVYSPLLGTGLSPDVRSIETVYTQGSVPALSDDPVFMRYRGFVEYERPNGRYQLAGELFRDHDTHRYNFQRVEAEAQPRFQGFRPGQRLTLHGLIAATASDRDVPYYLQYTIGGGGGLSAFRPDMIGTDGTKATLRSYQNYRFRDRNLLLMQAEYRIPLNKRVNTTVFYDAGQVAPRVSDLFDGLKQGTGFSVSYVQNGDDMVRFDVGYGAGEGMHYFWSFGGPRF